MSQICKTLHAPLVNKGSFSRCTLQLSSFSMWNSNRALACTTTSFNRYRC